jgi:hypothetical protein
MIAGMTRARLATGFVAALIAVGVPLTIMAQKKPQTATTDAKVFLTPTCGCCGKWADHLEGAGFKVTREVTTQLDAVPARQRVPERVRTCHTAVIGQYVVEGHVPADVIRQLLRERPKIEGIVVPGMPIGSPGMEGPYPRPYSIIAFKADGSTYEFARR